MRNTLLSILLIALLPCLALSATFTVTNTLNTGAGSLRDAITTANGSAGPHLINFNIPGAGPHTISVSSVLPTLNRAITIDATTQPGYGGTPIVRITKSAGSYGGLNIGAADCAVYGLEIFGFGYWGIQVINDASDRFRIGAPGKGNVIRGNAYYGISIMGGDDGFIQNNWVGVFSDGITADPNLYQGIMIGNGNSCFSTAPSNNNLVDGNIVGSNEYDGIKVYASNNNTISNNVIGAAGDAGCTDRSNLYYGIRLGCSSLNNRILTNIISYNDYGGINLEDAGTDFNRISQNTIFCNNGTAISRAAGANSNYPAPVISAATGAGCNGTSSANAIIEIFIDDACAGASGQQYVGTVTASAGGVWSYTGALFGSVVATATDPVTFVTSPFSAVRNTGVVGSPSTSCLILAIQTTPLEATWKQDHVALSWIAQETSTHTGFFIQRLDAGTWNEIGAVGTLPVSDGETRYTYNDYQMNGGIQYYRFRAIDQDGAVSFSNVVRVFAGETSRLSLFPQPAPAGGWLNCILTSDDPIVTEISDVTGKQLFTMTLRPQCGVLTIELPDGLTAGCYLLTTRLSEGITTTTPFMVY